jgi:maleylacetoacetate isomerase
MGCDTSGFERAMAVYRHASEHRAFRQAEPQRQPDYTAR